MNGLRIFKRKTVRKLYGPVKEGGCWGIRNREIKDILQREDIVKCIKSFRL
jgi:hypothetical protein